MLSAHSLGHSMNLKQLNLCLHNQNLISLNPMDSDGRKFPTVGSPKPVNNVPIPVSLDPSVNNVSIPVSPDLVTPLIPSSLHSTSEFHTIDGFTVVLVGGGDEVGDLVGSPSDWSSVGGCGWPSGSVGRPSLDPSPSSSFTPNQVFSHRDGEIGIDDRVRVLFDSPSNWSSVVGGWPSGTVARPSSDSSSSSSSMLAPKQSIMSSSCCSCF